MADISDSELFDSAVSDAAPQAAAEVAVTQQETPIQTGQQRDEHGRFATKADAPNIEHEQPAQTETHAENGKAIPVGAMQAEREKRQAAQAEAEALRREIAELRGMVTAQRQPAPQTPQQEQQPVDFWASPENYLKDQMNPVQQSVQEMRETIWELQASQVHGAQAINAAKEAAAELSGTPEGQALYAQITAKGNPFDNLVQWHQRQQTLATVGNDPQAWLNAEIEKRLSDPTFLAQAMERARGVAAQNGNRSQQPVTSIPPSLSRIPSGGNQADDGDMSDAGLFAHATR